MHQVLSPGSRLYSAVCGSLRLHGRNFEGPEKNPPVARVQRKNVDVERCPGCLQERRRCKEYIGWLLQQLKGWVSGMLRVLVGCNFEVKDLMSLLREVQSTMTKGQSQSQNRAFYLCR